MATGGWTSSRLFFLLPGKGTVQRYCTRIAPERETFCPGGREILQFVTVYQAGMPEIPSVPIHVLMDQLCAAIKIYVHFCQCTAVQMDIHPGAGA